LESAGKDFPFSRKKEKMDLDCLPLENESLRLLIARSIGPRILGLSLQDGPNLLAELPDFVTDRPDGKAYHFHGGHRLWRAPEDPILSYGIDDGPVEIAPIENGIKITKPAEVESGLEKSIRVVLPDNSSRVIITHQLKNSGSVPVKCTPWAITQFRTGGTAILPMNNAKMGFLPNRNLVLWPYTDLADRNFQFSRRYLLVTAAMESPFKVGFPNPVGWLAYWLEGVLFVKYAEYDPQATYPDYGSSSECYCNVIFLELETLGPLKEIQPGDSIEHVETWQLFHAPTRPENESDVQRLVEKMGVK
jgi:hypothetical protein